MYSLLTDENLQPPQGNQLTNQGRDSGSRAAIHYTGDTRKIHELRSDLSNGGSCTHADLSSGRGFFLSTAIYNASSRIRETRSTPWLVNISAVADKRRGSSRH